MRPPVFLDGLIRRAPARLRNLLYLSRGTNPLLVAGTLGLAEFGFRANELCFRIPVGRPQASAFPAVVKRHTLWDAS
jgi:hypothetical protein